MHIVTVSRQLGSLGDVIATVMAREMGYKLIGPDQVHERAHSCDPEFKDACTLYETEKGPGFWDRFFFDTPSYTALFKSLTYEFASQGNVVIIGTGRTAGFEGRVGDVQSENRGPHSHTGRSNSGEVWGEQREGRTNGAKA